MDTVLLNWKPDNYNPSDVPEYIYQGLCVFDYNTDYSKALAYRTAELPFIVINDPRIARTVERWNAPNYMEQMLGDVEHRTEYSINNHFMYFVPPTKRRLGGNHGNNNNNNERRKRNNRPYMPDGWQAPTRSMRMSFTTWLQHANNTNPNDVGPNSSHWYYRLIGCGLLGNDGSCDRGSSEYLYDELPFFQPTTNNNNSLYVVDGTEQKGIHCRFGMPGVIAENHYDHSRNTIVVLKGSRRYILAHPNQCENLLLYPKGHPSARHSSIDWSNVTQDVFDQHANFATAQVNEVVLQAGQALYLPTDWFHYIISLELNYQCNTRSGITYQFIPDLQRCGVF
jgi:Cupin-like domain